MANVIYDQFGHDVHLIPVDDDHFTVKVSVAVSSQFLSWVIALEGEAQIAGPESVKKQMTQIQLEKYYNLKAKYQKTVAVWNTKRGAKAVGGWVKGIVRKKKK